MYYIQYIKDYQEVHHYYHYYHYITIIIIIIIITIVDRGHASHNINAEGRRQDEDNQRVQQCPQRRRRDHEEVALLVIM